MFQKLIRGSLGFCCVLAMSAMAHASDFELILEIKSADRTLATKKTAIYPSKGKPPKRMVFKAKPGEPLRLLWRAANTHRSATVKGVLIHFFVVEQSKLGQQKVPKLGKDVIHEGAITTDFKPKDKANGQFTLKLPKRGSYLLRVETLGMLGKHGHEHFAALDLLIE